LGSPRRVAAFARTDSSRSSRSIASSALMINMHFSSKMSPAATQDSTLIRCACAFE
jgi:hypothetical protein